MRTFSTVPFNQHLGFELLDASDGTCSIRVAPLPWFSQENGVVHGGILSSIADTAAVHALVPSLAEGSAMTGVEFKINFLAPAAVDGEALVGRAKVIRRGKSIAVAESTVSQSERVVAVGLFTFMITTRA